MADIGTIKIPARITIEAEGLPDPLGVAHFNIELTVTGRPTPPEDEGSYLFSFDTTNVRHSMAQALREAADSLEVSEEWTHVPSQLLFEDPRSA